MSIASRPARALSFRRLAGVLGLALAAWGFARAAAAQDVPPVPRRPITDNAHTYNPYYLDMTEAELRRWQAKTRHPVVIWTEKKIPGRDFDDWCRETFERWRAERGNLGDGAALFLSTEEKTVCLEVGPGLRALLPGDAEARIAGVVEEVRGREKDPKDWDNPIIWTIYALTYLQNWLGR